MSRPLALALARRGAGFVATAAGAMVLVQCLLALAPGDAIDTLPNADELRPLLAAEWGLDEPLPARLLRALGRALGGELGHSLTVRPGAPVLDLLTGTGGASLLRVSAAGVIAVVVGFALARHAVLRRAAELFSALPAVVVALVAVHGLNAAAFACIERGWIARPAWFALPAEEHLFRTLLAVTILALSSGNLAQVAASARADLDALLGAPFVEAERARGGAVGPLVARHLVVPVSRALAGQAAVLLGSLVVVEHGLSLGGAGALFFQAVRLRDWPLAAGLAALAGAAVAVARLGAELLEVAIDPRARGTP